MALRYLKGVEGYENGYNTLNARDMQHPQLESSIKRQRPKPKLLEEAPADPGRSMQSGEEEQPLRPDASWIAASSNRSALDSAPHTGFQKVVGKNLEVHSLRKVAKLQEEQIRILYGELSLKQNDLIKLQQEGSTMGLQAQRMAESLRSLKQQLLVSEKEKEKLKGQVAECNRQNLLLEERRQSLEEDKRFLLIESSKQVDHREYQEKASDEIKKLNGLYKAEMGKLSSMTEKAAESDERCKVLQSHLDLLEKSLSEVQAERQATKTELTRYGRVFDENLKLCSELKDCQEQRSKDKIECIAFEQKATLAAEMYEELRLERDGLCRQVSSLEAELVKYKNEWMMLKEEKGDADAELREANLLCSSSSAHINELLQEMEVVRENAKILEKERESYGQRLGEARAEAEKWKGSCHGLQSDIEELNENYAKKLAHEKDRADNFSGSMKIQSEQVKRLKQEWDLSLTSYTEKLQLLQAELLDRENRLRSESSKNEELLQRQKHTEKKFRKQTSQMQSLESRLEGSMNKCAALEEQKESLREDIGRLIEEFENVGRKHQEEAKQDLRSLESENIKLTKLVDKTNADLEMAKEEFGTLFSRYLDLEERERRKDMELTGKIRIIEDLEKSLAEHKDRAYLSQEKFRSLNQEAQALSREVIDLRNQVQNPPMLIDDDPVAQVLNRATAQLQSSRARVKEAIITSDLAHNANVLYHSSRPMVSAELDTASPISTPNRSSKSVIGSASGDKGLSLINSNDLVSLIDRCQYLKDQLIGAYLQETEAEVEGRTDDVDSTA